MADHQPSDLPDLRRSVPRRFLELDGRQGEGGGGRWAFQEITDPWDAEHVIRAKFLEPVAGQP